jgi:hypothetical protein
MPPRATSALWLETAMPVEHEPFDATGPRRCLTMPRRLCNLRGTVDGQDIEASEVAPRSSLEILLAIQTNVRKIAEAQRACGEGLDGIRTSLRAQSEHIQHRLSALSAHVDARIEETATKTLREVRRIKKRLRRHERLAASAPRR